jgi:energy-coupling factor transporter ATP-binding protein EcfA2
VAVPSRVDAQAPLLEVRGVSKQFGGTQALANVSLHLRRGEILALLGENGAGKSTLIKILAGVYTPDAGSLRYDGEEVGENLRGRPLAASLRQGLCLRGSDRRRRCRRQGGNLFTDSIYAIATAKTNAEAEAIKGCKGCSVLAIEDTPIGDLANRMPQLTTSLLAKYGKRWTYGIAVNDLYFDFSAPSLQSAGVNPATGFPRQISAGDGSVPAFQGIREKHYQIGTVAEPLHLHGWMCIDELNRAFAGEKPSGFVPPPHLFIASNLDHDGGPNNIYDPENGCKNMYRKIWGK